MTEPVHCAHETGYCSWTFKFDGNPCDKNCTSDARKKPSEYRCETCALGIVEKDKEKYTHRYCKHPEMQYRGSESILLLGTEIIHIQHHGCRLHRAHGPTAQQASAFIPMASPELIALAEKEWANREERKQSPYDKRSWVSGWFDGYFSKPKVTQSPSTERGDNKW